MPELVNQLNMRKQQIQFQLAAAQRWPELIDADEAELKELSHYISVIGDAWTAWLDCLGTTPEQEKSFMYLYNSNHLDVLLLEYPRWQASLKAGGFTALRTIARFNAYAQVLKDAGFDDLVEQLLRHKIGLSDVNTALLRGVAEASIKERIETFQLDGFRPDIKADQLTKLQSAISAFTTRPASRCRPGCCSAAPTSRGGSPAVWPSSAACWTPSAAPAPSGPCWRSSRAKSPRWRPASWSTRPPWPPLWPPGRCISTW